MVLTAHRGEAGRSSPRETPRTSAEAEGFEPSVPLRAQHISSVSHSAALARFPGPPTGWPPAGNPTWLGRSGAKLLVSRTFDNLEGGPRTGKRPARPRQPS